MRNETKNRGENRMTIYQTKMILSKDEFQKRNDKEDSTIYITREMVEESAGQITDYDWYNFTREIEMYVNHKIEDLTINNENNIGGQND